MDKTVFLTHVFRVLCCCVSLSIPAGFSTAISTTVAAQQDWDPGLPWVLSDRGSVEPGKIVRITPQHIEFSDRGPLSRAGLSAVLFVPPVAPEIRENWLRKNLHWSPSEHRPSGDTPFPLKKDRLLFTNGDLLFGEFLGFTNRKIAFRISDSLEPALIPIRRVRAIRFSTER